MSKGLGQISVGLQVLGGRTGIGLVGCVLRRFRVKVLGSTEIAVELDTSGEAILDLAVW